jgi:thiol-disulfide isomerase/thioredoxin
MRISPALKLLALLFFGAVGCTALAPPSSDRYLDHIGRAQDRYDRGALHAALLQFDSAFAEYPSGFGRDLALALEVAGRAGDPARAGRYARQLVVLGSDLGYFQQERYRDFLASPAWPALEAEFPALVAKRRQQRDTLLRQRMDELYTRDQLLAANFINANVHPRYPTVTRDFAALVARTGFPGEATVGLRFANDTTIGLPHYYVILLHHYHMGYPLLADRLAEFSQRGLLDPRHEQQYRGMIPEDPALVTRINARRTASPKSPIYTADFAHYDNAPVFEETYLYPKRPVNLTERTIQNQAVLLADWNGDSLFTEVGTDYYGFQWPGASTPQLYPLRTVNYFVRNDKLFEYRPANNSLLVVDGNAPPGTPRFLDRLPTVELTDGSRPALAEQPYVIIYFWASWCAPCLRTLRQVDEQWPNLSQKDVLFLPIALESSPESIEKIYREQQFRFPRYLGAEVLKERFLVRAFPTAYVFRGGELVRQLSSRELLTYWAALE